MSALLNLFTNNLIPIFLIAGSGFALSKWRKIDTRTLSQIIFNLFCPALIFSMITHSHLQGKEIFALIGITAISTLLAGGMAWLLGRFFGFSRKMITALVLIALLPNTGNFGLATVQFAFGDEALTYATIIFTIATIMLYSVGVLVASIGSTSAQEGLTTVFKVPALYAAILGILFAQFRIELPLFIERAADLLGSGTIPAMLVLLGMQLSSDPSIQDQSEPFAIDLPKSDSASRWNWRKIGALAIAGFTRLIVGPMFGYATVLTFGVKGAAMQASMIEMATPTAVMCSILAIEYEIEPEFVATAVLVTTILSPLTITPIMAWLGG